MQACMIEQYPQAEPVARATPTPPHSELVAIHVNELLGFVHGRVLTKVSPLWPGRWRVNVFCREDSNGLIERVAIRHSFFVSTNKAGKIIRCVADGQESRNP